jgi:hypothetical protein
MTAISAAVIRLTNTLPLPYAVLKVPTSEAPESRDLGELACAIPAPSSNVTTIVRFMFSPVLALTEHTASVVPQAVGETSAIGFAQDPAARRTISACKAEKGFASNAGT